MSPHGVDRLLGTAENVRPGAASPALACYTPVPAMEDVRAPSGGLEARVRAVAAERLGVAEGDLTPALSLVDELAVDSLDVADLATALEDAFDIALPDVTLDDVRTYGDVVGLVQGALAGRHAAGIVPAESPIRVVARLARAGMQAPPLERSGEFTPYFAQMLLDDALRLGAGSRVEVGLVSPRDDGAAASVHARLAPLAAHGIDLSIVRQPRDGRRQSSAA